MVPLREVPTVMGLLLSNGFAKVGTKYDRLPSAEDFRRYEKTVDDGINPPFRLTIDFFVVDVPTFTTSTGWTLVRPDILLSYYSTIHSSKSAWAVVQAQRLLKSGLKPDELEGNPQLIQAPGGNQ